MKSVQIRSCFWSVFFTFELNTERYFSLNAGKYGPEITPYLDNVSRSDGSAAEYKNRNRLQDSLKNPQNLFNANKKETKKNFRLCSWVIFVDFKQILAN